ETLGMTLPRDTGAWLGFGIAVRNLAACSAAATLADIVAGKAARCLLAWVPLMAGADEAGVREEGKRLAGEVPDRRGRGEYGAAALLFSELAGHAEAWSATLEGWNVEESQVVARWKAQGEERGLQKGRAEGRQEGRVETQRDALLRCLRARLPATLTEE